MDATVYNSVTPALQPCSPTSFSFSGLTGCLKDTAGARQESNPTIEIMDHKQNILTRQEHCKKGEASHTPNVDREEARVVGNTISRDTVSATDNPQCQETSARTRPLRANRQLSVDQTDAMSNLHSTVPPRHFQDRRRTIGAHQTPEGKLRCSLCNVSVMINHWNLATLLPSIQPYLERCLVHSRAEGHGGGVLASN